jgi:hypothetical protein
MASAMTLRQQLHKGANNYIKTPRYSQGKLMLMELSLNAFQSVLVADVNNIQTLWADINITMVKTC